MKAFGILALFFVTSAIAAPVSLIDLEDTLLRRTSDENRLILVSETFTPDSKFGKGFWLLPKRVHGKHPDSEKILSCVSASIENVGVRLVTTEGIRAFRTQSGAEAMVSNEVSTTIPFPTDAVGKTLSVQFRFTGKGSAQTFILFQPGSHPLVRGGSAIIPAGAEQAHTFLRLNGVGDITVQSAEIALLKSEVPPEQPDILAYTHGFLDEKFFLPVNTAFPLSFMLKRDKSKRYRNVFLLIELPLGYRLVGTDKIQKISSSQDGMIRIAYDTALASTLIDQDFCFWRTPPVFLISDLPASENLAIMRYGLEVDGQELPKRMLKLGTMAQLIGLRPKRFFSGIMQQSGSNLPATEAEFYAQLLKTSGFNAMQCTPSEELNAVLTNKNFLRIASIWGIRDGYPRGKTPPFIGIDGKPFRDQLCPIASAQPGHFDEALQKIMEKADHFSNNWEAYSSDYKGCFCQDCFVAFASFSNIPEAELKPLWPREVINRYHDSWVRFRSLQHAAIVAALEESTSRIGKQYGRESHFIPMLSRSACSEAMAFGKQYSPVDFLKYLKLVNVWGPYTHSTGMHRLYDYLPGKHLTHYLEVRDVKRFVDRHAGHAVGIFGFPYGCNGTNVNSPEAIALETIDNFLTGYAGSLVYWFNFDYRYYTRMVETNQKISLYEDCIYDWSRTDQVAVEAVSPLITPEHIHAWLASTRLCPEMDSIQSTLQLQAYRKNDQVLAAVGNFWEKGGAYVRLTAQGLKGNYLVNQPHLQKFRRTTGGELASGLMLYIPALTWEFFLLEPDIKQKVTGTEYSASGLQKEYTEQLPQLKASMEMENTQLARRRNESAIVDFNFDETPEIIAGEVTVKELRKENKQALAVHATNYSAVLEPAFGGQLASLKAGGTELASSWIGRIGFLRPSSFLLETPMQIQQIRALDNHIEIKLNRKNVTGLEITQTWIFRDSSILESVEVVNRTGTAIKLMPRFHSMLKYLAPGGSFSAGQHRFPAEPQHRLLIVSSDSEKLAAKLQANSIIPFEPAPIEFSSPELPQKLGFQTTTPLYGIYLWNTPGAANGSFEPVFPLREVPAGEKTEFQQKFLLPDH